MPNVRDLGQSNYIGKDDVGDGMLVTIEAYEWKDVSMDSEPTDAKYTLSFKECKPLVLNLTNGNMIAHIMHNTYGISTGNAFDEAGNDLGPANENFDNWIGRQIVLFNDPTIQFQGRITGGIRVRAPQPVAPQQPPVQQPPQQPAPKQPVQQGYRQPPQEPV